MMSPLRVAVIGCGDVANVHLDAIADNARAELVAVCDVQPAVAQVVAERFGVPAFTDHRTLLAEIHPDVVHVCTPHAEHAQPAIHALAAGVHVLCEKPLADDLTSGEAMLEAAESSRAKFGVCFQNRYNPTAQRMKAELESGALGAVRGARAQVMWTRTADYYRAKPWRGTWAGSGGGILMNQAIHTLDLLQWFVGDVDAVTGTTSLLMFGDTIEVEDTATAVLEHVGGVRSNFYATLTHFADTPVLVEVVCEGGTLRLEGDLRLVRPGGAVEVLAEADVVRTARNYWGASHARLIDDFYASLPGEDPFWIDATEAYKTLDIVQSIYAI